MTKYVWETGWQLLSRKRSYKPSLLWEVRLIIRSRGRDALSTAVYRKVRTLSYSRYIICTEARFEGGCTYLGSYYLKDSDYNIFRYSWQISGSWIKIDQLDVTCFIISLFNAQHVSDVNTSILRSLRLICWVISWVVLHNVTPTRIEPEQYNPWNNSTNKSQAPEDGWINIRNMLSIK